MKKFTRIEESKVVEILEAEKLPDFHPDLVWIEAPDWVSEGDSYVNGNFSKPVKDIDEAKQEKKSEVRAIFDTIIASGLDFNGKNYQINESARADMGFVNQKFLANVVSPHGGFWRDSSNNMNPMTDDEAKLLIETAFNTVFYYRKISWTHTDNINAMTRSEDVESYDVNTLWND